MAFSYCPHCGYKNMYSLQSPKFCGGCGEDIKILSAAKTNSTNIASSKPVRKISNRSRSIEDFDDDPDGTEIYEVPNITKLSYSIERDSNTFKLKDVFPESMIKEIENESKSSPSQKKPKKRGRPKKS
jgi:hypothetical protein